MPQIMTHSLAVQPLVRIGVECRIASQGELESEVDCPTFLVELTQEVIDTSLEDDCVVEGDVEQDELAAEVEEGEC